VRLEELLKGAVEYHRGPRNGPGTGLKFVPSFAKGARRHCDSGDSNLVTVSPGIASIFCRFPLESDPAAVTAAEW
jgi:hypothetical protein